MRELLELRFEAGWSGGTMRHQLQSIAGEPAMCRGRALDVRFHSHLALQFSQSRLQFFCKLIPARNAIVSVIASI